jgi:2-polyprenyl-6-methoxyphenol hydroxylase-like FAD-dependent oxidoreductase
MVKKNVTKFEDVLEYRVSRGKLREWLAIGVDIKWGKIVSAFTEDEEGVAVECSDGTVERGAILVGADGVTSQIRQHLFPDRKTTSCLPVTIFAAQ